MAERYWIYEEVEKKFKIPAPQKLFKKNPDNLGELISCLKLQPTDTVLITPESVNQGNRTELITIYQNMQSKIRVAERYASVQYTSPNHIVSPAMFLGTALADCLNEQEKEIWLRAASPVVNSANILGTEFSQPIQLSNPQLVQDREKIIELAHELNITYHIYSKYRDDRQLWNDLTAEHAFPVTPPQD